LLIVVILRFSLTIYSLWSFIYFNSSSSRFYFTYSYFLNFDRSFDTLVFY